METRRYKNSGELISLLGFGCMRLPMLGESEIDKAAAQEMVDYAIAHGVNYFDTAYMYHDGKSEPFTGEALAKHPRASFNLATKMPLVSVSSKADVERIFNEQLQNCRVDYFDYYLLHNINESHWEKVESYGIYEFAKEKQRQGKIRRLGFSFHDKPELLMTVAGRREWDFAQIQLNYLDWELQDAGLQYKILNDKGIPVVVMEPVRGGALASLCEKSTALFKAARPSASTASWALRYAASLPGVLTVLSGMSSMDQLRGNISTMNDFVPLNEQDYTVIEKALDAYREESVIPCTACRYCMDCPSGADIPKVFGIYNNYLQGQSPRNEFIFDLEYNNILGKGKQAQECSGCGQCLSLCPQHIDIPQWMETINAFARGRAAM
ncbi:MAG: aldo/keto reductase [Spirochaetia bacterium]|jgi:predicted aldo/keto reductase-like oxidoreductase|nr:aldo/keto reductase [Spirochaetia bacterium]